MTTTPVETAHTDLMTAAGPGLPAEAFAERVLAASLGTMEIFAAYFGDRLGWYRALHEQGPLTSGELAHATGTAERYAREWLEQQAANGYLTLEDADVPTADTAATAHTASTGAGTAGTAHTAGNGTVHTAGNGTVHTAGTGTVHTAGTGTVHTAGTGTAGAPGRRYSLPAGHAEVLLDGDSLVHLGPLARMLAASGLHLDDIVEAYRTGGGVSWQRLGTNAREGQAALNRPLFLHALAQRVLPGVGDLDARLRAGARVADVGCGEGWSAIGIAAGYPGVTVDGFDVDVPSVEAARRHAASRDVVGRVTFTHQDVAARTLGDGTPYDAVFAFECVHDLADPVGFLATMRGAVAADGFVVVMDELTEEHFTAPAGPWERMLYGFSLTTCLVDGMAHAGSAGTGTVMRPETLERYAVAAGFSRVEILPSPVDIAFRFYRLHT